MHAAQPLLIPLTQVNGDYPHLLRGLLAIPEESWTGGANEGSY